MHISRVQIEEGFLDSLDIKFSSGLNVLIGARGTGKSSLIELIRFCLGTHIYSQETAKRSREHALSVLGSGKVTVTLDDGGRLVTVTRSARDEAPRSSGPYLNPIVFSQTEIETVGVQAAGRLKLLDGFRTDRRALVDQESAAIALIQLLSAEVASVSSDIEELRNHLAEAPSLDEQLAAIAPEEKRLLALSSETAEKKTELDKLSNTLARLSVATSNSERFVAGIGKWRSAIQAAISARPTQNAPVPDEMTGQPSSLEEELARVERALTAALSNIERAEVRAADTVKALHGKRLAEEEIARSLRREIEALQAGAGATVRAGQQLRERKAHLDAIRAQVDEKTAELARLTERRAAAQDELDRVRTSRFQERADTAAQLDAALGPRIRLSVTSAAQWDVYAGAIAEVLKGSGLRYNDLSMQIAESVSPRELVRAAETGDSAGLAVAALISPDRAARVLSQIRMANIGELATVVVDDDVEFQLLDGTDYKDFSALSVGQRCTVVLPIIMQHDSRTLIVDQPEDHIDNAFITDTLIKAIHSRSAESQLILSTHNANIPVLGHADHVIQLSSDGKRGFVACSGQLDGVDVVNAITSIMEGGIEAFRTRAKFYDEKIWL